MILVDTSVWVEHFRNGLKELETLLNEGEVATHPFIIGELACGRLTNRSEILSLLQSLPTSTIIDFEEYLHFVNSHRLMGKGIGFVDIHILASAYIDSNFLWTLDKKLHTVASEMKLSKYGIP
jgi:predicted nucleic acid-binding protein